MRLPSSGFLCTFDELEYSCFVAIAQSAGDHTKGAGRFPFAIAGEHQQQAFIFLRRSNFCIDHGLVLLRAGFVPSGFVGYLLFAHLRDT